MTDRCFCVFEGGGAKGIAHVGALAALEESGLDLCGFAGTSAGAVIAALAAAGYRSGELINRSSTVLDLVDLDPSNIWSGDAFDPAGRPHRLFGPIGWLGILAARGSGKILLAILMVAILMTPAALASWSSVPRAAIFYCGIAALFVVFLGLSLVVAGLASLKSFERGLNQLLRLRLASRLTKHPPHHARISESVTFEDMKNAGCPPLRVVAADISSRELRLFSYESSPKDGVASAVAASVCIPIIFKPWKIDSSLYLDGGLVSNLPAWAFDAERALDRDAWTAVVQVGDTHTGSRPWGLGILFAGIMTGIFGSGLLNIRNVDRLKAVRLKLRLKLLQFDPGLPMACEIVDDARLRCLERLVYQLRDVPLQMKDICERIGLRAERIINLALRTQEKPAFRGRLRVSLLVPTKDDPSSLSAEFQHGFEDCTDERVRLPMQGSFAGQALEEGEPLYLDSRDSSWASYLARPQDRWLRRLIWPEMRWALCVPYVNREAGISLVATIDSNAYLDVEDDLVDVTMASISDAIVTMLDEFLPKEAFGDGGS